MRCARCMTVWFAELESRKHELVPEYVDAREREAQPREAGSARASRPASESQQESLSDVEALAQRLAEKISGEEQPSSAFEEGGRHQADRQSAGLEGEEPDRGEEPPFEKPEQEHRKAMLPAVVEPRSPFLVAGWTAWAVFVAGLAAGFLIYREEFVDLWPPVGQLYEITGLMEPDEGAARSGLPDFGEDLQIRNQAEPRANPDGTFDLIISGTIKNDSDQMIQLPRFKGVLRDADRKTLHEWRVEIRPGRLGPSEQIEFRTVVPSVPPQTTEYEILPDTRR